MKAVTLLLLRLATGLYLLAWSAVKLLNTERAVGISDDLYLSTLSTPVIQHGLGALGGVLAIFVILGFFRTFSYAAQTAVLALGAVALGRIAAGPLDLARGIEASTTLMPYAALVLAALAPLVWKANDAVSLDRFLAWAEGRLAKDETAAVAAPAVAAVALDETPAVPAAEVPAPAADIHGEAQAETAVHEEAAAEAQAEAPAQAEPAIAEAASVEAGHEEHAEHAHDEPHKQETHAGSAAVH